MADVPPTNPTASADYAPPESAVSSEVTNEKERPLEKGMRGPTGDGAARKKNKTKRRASDRWWDRYVRCILSLLGDMPYARAASCAVYLC